MTVWLFRGDARVDGLDPAHRGIAYGDGLFETMRVHAGEVPWWSRHWQRMARDAARLGIALPDVDHLEREIHALSHAQADGVIKLVVSRGARARGYAPSAGPSDWQLSLHPMETPAQAPELRLRWCDLQLGHQPALAGVKHCNRLEQVLARAEWGADEDVDEGLLCDQAGHVVSATSANLFVLQAGDWLTPKVDRCGVAGVCREWALQALRASESTLRPADIDAADAVFLCNAVRGILPVARLGSRTWAPHPSVAHAQALLAQAHPAFAARAAASPGA